MSPRVSVTVLHRFCAAAVAGFLAVGASVTTGTTAGAAIPVPVPDGGTLSARAAWAPSDDPADLHVLVNKARPVTPRDWAPDDLVHPDVTALGANDRLRPGPARALEALARAAERATGHELVLASGYRSAAYQRDLYRRYADSHGHRAADTFSARSGFSEHQTGLVADVAEEGTPYTRFASTASGRWVAAHAWRFGFVVRYPDGAQHVTGYEAEAWHLRYVGTGLAAHMRVTGVETLEEAFGARPAPDYAPR